MPIIETEALWSAVATPSHNLEQKKPHLGLITWQLRTCVCGGGARD